MAVATITTAGLNLLRDAIRDADSPVMLYVAVGTDNTAPAASQTRLLSESFRKAVGAFAVGGNGVVIISAVLGAADAVGVAIAEVGWFLGDSATSAANSPVMFARGLYSHTKTGSESLQLSLTLTFS